MKKIILLLLVTVVISCRQSNENLETESCCPHCTILLQPYDEISSQQAKTLSQTLGEHIYTAWGEINVTNIKVLPIKQLTDEQKNAAKTRYRASKILDFQANDAKTPHQVIIGITSNDISTTSRGKEDYGIQGLSYVGRNNCVVSTFRLRSKADLWKLVVHEFGHGYFYTHAPHCPDDNPNCIMQDGHGAPNWKTKTKACDTCRF